jgi:hypothetical protein
MNNNRLSTPDLIKRQLRKEAGFGCVKCGFPIYDYHHIVPYTPIDPHFRPQDMLVLCPNCHREATVGAMLEQEQRYLKAHPFNLQRGYANGQLKINQKELVVSTGGVQLINDSCILVIDDEPLLALSSGQNGTLELSLAVYDDKDNILATIDQNSWRQGDSSIWDMEFGYQWLKIRQKTHSIVLNVDARKYPVEIRADLWRKRQMFRLNKVGLIMRGAVANASMLDLCFVAAHFHVDTHANKFQMRPDPRFGCMYFVSDFDVNRRIRKGIRLLSKLRKGLNKPAN